MITFYYAKLVNIKQLPFELIHVPSLVQGDLSHSSTSFSQELPVQPGGHTQRNLVAASGSE